MLYFVSILGDFTECLTLALSKDLDQNGCTSWWK